MSHGCSSATNLIPETVCGSVIGDVGGGGGEREGERESERRGGKERTGKGGQTASQKPLWADPQACVQTGYEMVQIRNISG